MVKLTHFDINQFTPFSVGFDRVFDRLVDYGTTYETGGFPPYNIRKTDDFKHVIEIALAGFSKDDISVEHKPDENSLIIKSQIDKDEKEVEDNEGILYRGISKRQFTRSFSIADDVIVKGAKLENGLLSVELQKIIPEEKKPKTIEIR